MAIRLSGMASGLDTDAIIKELMAAQSLKKTRIENNQTKLTWTQEKWKELNSKIYKLYTDQVSKLRLQGNYQTKKVSSANEAKVTATATAGAPAGTQMISVDKLASSQYVTGAKKTDLTADTNLSSLDASYGVGTIIKISVGTDNPKVTEFEVKADSTVNDFVNTLKNAGLNANFDSSQQRIFISSKNSGVDNGFSITSAVLSTEASDLRASITSQLSYSSLSTTDKTTVDNALYSLQYGTVEEKEAAETSLIDILEKNVEKENLAKATAYLKELKIKEYYTDSTLITELEAKHFSSLGEEFDTVMRNEATAAIDKQIEDESLTMTEAERSQAIEDYYNSHYTERKDQEVDSLVLKEVTARVATDMATTEGQAEVNALKVSGLSEATLTANFTTEEITKANLSSFGALADVIASRTANLSTSMNSYESLGTIESGSTSQVLSGLGLGEITGAAVGTSGTDSMVVVAASDSQITLNGAVLTGSTNALAVNGVTYDLKALTTPGETISLTVSDDTKATYDMVKDFVKKYNEILKEMNDLYYADSARGYDPLTEDQKKVMSEDQIKKWEARIKDSLLRRDSTLGSLVSSMKTAISSSVMVDGKSYALSTYGIQTSPNYSEKGLLHIFGDAEDSTYAVKDDKLMKALGEDPETVTKVLSTIAKNLSDVMNDKMKATTMSSSLTFYNDKQMTTLQKQYSNDLLKMESRLSSLEEKYYKQFAALETAMSKLNSQSASLAGLFGTQQ